MCGIAGIIGYQWRAEELLAMIETQRHRGPDGEGIYLDSEMKAGLGHNRLSILDLSDAGEQPMWSHDRRHIITFNGEIYNYLELRRELQSEFTFRTQTDTEVLLAAYQKWGTACLDRLIGMFAFIIWDADQKRAFAARDRFGVKPMYYHRRPDGTILIASEIKALHAAGVRRDPNEKTWATYLTYGLYDHSEETFWLDIVSLPAGHFLTWKDDETCVTRWYDIADRIGEGYDQRPKEEVEEEYFSLMKDSVELRFRSDVPVGINLSGGLDSSSLLGLVHEVQGRDSDVKAFTFITGNTNYDELPWVEKMLGKTNHTLVVSKLTPDDVPDLAADVQHYQDEPFAGLPTLAYAKLFEEARRHGITVLLDGNGMDEQWAGYDYYQRRSTRYQPSFIQGTNTSPVRPDCLTREFRALAEPLVVQNVFGDQLRNLQYRDTRFTKIPRAMRFNDRISMRSSTELREPFLDHRMFELALRQPAERKIRNGVGKKMLRDISRRIIPANLSESPKRVMQTPQREWLRGELNGWVDEQINRAVSNNSAGWFEKSKVFECWKRYCSGDTENSFYIWQWVGVGSRLDSRSQMNGSRTTAVASNPV